jgi:cytoskeletal protein RodZ
MKNQKKGVSLVTVIIILVIIAVLVTILVVTINNQNNQKIKDLTENSNKDTINYQTVGDNTKVNTSDEVTKTQTVEEVTIENSKIVYENGISKITSKVTNNAIAKDNLRFTIKAVANDGSTIAQTIGYVGKIGANETKYIDSNITADLANAKSILYEVIK